MFAQPVLAACVLLLCAGGVAAQESNAAASTADNAQGDTSFLVENVTRAEVWRFFEPFDGGGSEPDYAFIGNRSTLGAHYQGRRWSMRGAIQYVRIENLPRGAIGPGLLGTGGAYFFQAAGSYSYQFYLRALSAALASSDGRSSIELGRVSLDEPAPGETSAADRLARERISGRLLGDMRSSMYQRAWDGVRVRAARGAWRAGALAAFPTQGTFEESANLPLDRVRVAAVDVVRVAATAQPLRLHAFAVHYRDTRARPGPAGQHELDSRWAPTWPSARSARRRSGSGRGGPARWTPSPGPRCKPAIGTGSHIALFRRSSKAAIGGRRRPGSPGCAPAGCMPQVTATPGTVATARSSRCCRPAISSSPRTPMRS